MDDDLPNEETVREFLAVQKADIQVRFAEIEARSKDFDNEKEVALRSLDAQAKDREQERTAKQTESLYSKLFISFLVILFAVTMGYFVSLGHINFVQMLLYEATKVIVGAFGGAGITILYFNRRNNMR